MLDDIFALFRRRRAPARAKAPNSARWKIDLASLGGQLFPGRGGNGVSRGKRSRSRRDDDAQRQAIQQNAAEHGYLAAHAVEKAFAGRRVVKGASLYVRRGEAVGLLGPEIGRASCRERVSCCV